MEDKLNNQASAPELKGLSGHPDDRPQITELPHVILASASPRRAEILRTVQWPFEALPLDVDETRNHDEDAETYVQRLALAKAGAAAQLRPRSLVVGADTVVVIEKQILGKPTEHEDARSMLRQLSGRWHQVLTGVALVNGLTSESRVAYQSTEVKFAVMSPDEIDWYVSTSEPMDKAGAYAIQGLGSRFIEGIRGDYFNVVGLPVRLLYELLALSAG